jgi:hypothetical protein
VRFVGPNAQNAGVEALVAEVRGGELLRGGGELRYAGGGGDGPAAASAAAATAAHAYPGGLYKLMLGTFHFAAWTGPEWPNSSSTSFAANNSHWDVTADCRAGCLYDLRADPNEHTNLASAEPALVAHLRARLEAINRTAFSPDRGSNGHQLGCKVGVEAYGGFWGPFLGQ